jgi:hypothetical protein
VNRKRAKMATAVVGVLALGFAALLGLRVAADALLPEPWETLATMGVMLAALWALIYWDPGR